MGTASSSSEPRAGRRRFKGLAAWLAALAACTLLLWTVRDAAHEAHMALAYLLIVLGASAGSGRWVGLVLAVLAFLTFNFFLLPPYYTLAIEDPLDWWVLVAFLVTGMTAAQLFHRAVRARETAEDRAREMERLAGLGAESLAVPRAVDAVAAIARVILAELPVRSARVLVFEGDSPAATTLARAPGNGEAEASLDLPAAARHGRTVLVGRRGQLDVATHDADLGALLAAGAGYVAVMVPLVVREQILGVLRLDDPGGLRLDPAQAAFVHTLTYYAALAVERVRLAAQAEHVEALREADRLKDALLASVSHDLRTPLTTIRALATELRVAGDDRSAIIEEEADRLNRLVTDLLDLSRIRGGSLPLDLRVNAAEDLVGATLQRLAGVSGADRIDVTLPGGGGLPVGRFDFVHALRALANLVENALRHTPDEGRVELEVKESGDALVFEVRDRGPGVSPADEARIFEPFYRGSAGDAAPAGTGLGLAIARSVAEAQGGSVIHRPRLGGGSIFELRLPRVIL